MFKYKLEKLINEYGVKREYIINLIGSNRVTFKKKLENNDFNEHERAILIQRYGSLLN